MADTQEKEYYLDLGRKFKTLRKRVGKTTEEVAEEIGVDRAMIAQFENYGKRFPRIGSISYFRFLALRRLKRILMMFCQGKKKSHLNPAYQIAASSAA